MIGAFIGATGTGCGKTWLARGLARACVRSGQRVLCVKPVETGVSTAPDDALALGRAAGRPELAYAPGFARFRAPLSPRAATLGGEPPLDFRRLLTAVRSLFVPSEVAIVEGAGGLFTPLAEHVSMADMARALGLPVLLAAPNALGTLSHTLATVRAAEASGLRIATVVLVPALRDDASARDNRTILAEELKSPVVQLPRCGDDDDALAAAVDEVGLRSFLGPADPYPS